MESLIDLKFLYYKQTLSTFTVLFRFQDIQTFTSAPLVHFHFLLSNIYVIYRESYVISQTIDGFSGSRVKKEGFWNDVCLSWAQSPTVQSYEQILINFAMWVYFSHMSGHKTY